MSKNQLEIKPEWTDTPIFSGVYICRHYWDDGTQAGTDYLYRFVSESPCKWVNLIGEPDKRIIDVHDEKRMRFFGPIPAIPKDLWPA